MLGAMKKSKKRKKGSSITDCFYPLDFYCSRFIFRIWSVTTAIPTSLKRYTQTSMVVTRRVDEIETIRLRLSSFVKIVVDTDESLLTG